MSHHKDGHVFAGSADRERERDKVIPQDREIADVSSGRHLQDQPLAERDPPRLQHQPESLLSQNRPHGVQVPAMHESLSSKQIDRIVPVANLPFDQQNPKTDDHPLPIAHRDEVPTPTPASTNATLHSEKIERLRFNHSEGRIYIGRLDWNASKSDLVKLCEKYVDTLFFVLLPYLTCSSRFGEVIDSFIPFDREKNKPKGFAFVTFA
jgi:hypothetical protein